MFFGKGDEIIYIRLNSVHPSLHRWDCVTLSTQTNSTTHHGTELLKSNSCGSSTVHPGQIASKYKNLVWFQVGYVVGSKVRTMNIVVNPFCHDMANILKLKDFYSNGR